MKTEYKPEVVKLRCPLCGRGHLLDEAKRPGTVHAILHKPEEADRASWFLKCPACHNQIGVSPDIIE